MFLSLKKINLRKDIFKVSKLCYKWQTVMTKNGITWCLNSDVWASLLCNIIGR